MAIRDIIYFTDHRLRTRCEEVPLAEITTPVIQTLIDDMFETMYHANGVGLAANQIGICKQIAVIDVEGDKHQQITIINPRVIVEQGEQKPHEGCLSVPGGFDIVSRPAYVKVSALDRFGKPFEVEGKGVLAECLHHEIDHLNGKLYIDLLSPMKRQRAKERCLKHLKRQRGK
ncbi:MAG: peptide deformylase [Gammaproteobacteria bacterium]